MKIVHASEIIDRHGSEKLALVASRRTDMPRFYTGELVQGLNTGIFHPGALMNPVFELRFVPENIHSIGLWSQDFSRWLKHRTEVHPHYNYWFRFTILPDDSSIKPVAPSVISQLEQVREISVLYGPGAITVCLDPVLRYRKKGGITWTDPFREDYIRTVFESCAASGLKKIRISFIDYYKKVESRASRSGIEFYYPGHDPDDGWSLDKARMIRSMADNYSLELESCCEPGLVEAGITTKGSCVDGPRMAGLFGPGLCLKPDTGQRRSLGCGCTRSLDIGRYTETGPLSHHCFHDCPQCYARRG